MKKLLLVGVALIFTLTNVIATGYNATAMVSWFMYAAYWPTGMWGGTCSSNDIAQNQCVGGLSRLSSYYNSVLNSTANVMFIDGGGSIAIGSNYLLFNGAVESWWFRKYNVTAIAPGMLDWMFGSNAFMDLVRQSGIPCVSSNMVNKTTRSLACRPYVLKTMPNGIVIGIVAATGSGVPAFRAKYSVYTRESWASAAARSARDAGAHAVILLDNDEYDRTEHQAFIAKLGSDVDVVLNVMTPPWSSLSPPMDINFVSSPPAYVYSTRGLQYSHSAFRLDLQFDANRRLIKSGYKITPMDNRVPSDPVTVAYLEPIQAAVRRAANVVLGTIDFDTDILNPNVPSTYSSSTARIVTDAYLFFGAKYGATIAIVNAGAVRDIWYQGNITSGRTALVYPFIDKISVTQLTGLQLIQTLQEGTVQNPPVYEFPMVSGLQFAWNPDMPQGDITGRVTSVQIVDATTGSISEVRPSALYTVTSNGYMRMGGDGYATLATATVAIDNLGVTDQCFKEFFLAHPSLHRAQYAKSRSTLSTSVKVYSFYCDSSHYLAASTGECTPCPIGRRINAASNASVMWDLIVSSTVLDGSRPSTSNLILINYGTMAISWAIKSSAGADVTLFPSTGLISVKQSIAVNMTVAARTSATSFSILVAGQHLADAAQCYLPLSTTISVIAPTIYELFIMPSYILSLSIPISAATCLLMLIFAIAIYSNRNTVRVRAMQGSLLLVTLAGGTMFSIGALSFALTPTSSLLCNARWWLTGLGYVTMFAPLFAKAYRVAKIFNGGLTLVTIRTADLGGVIIALDTGMAVLLIIQSSSSAASTFELVSAPGIAASAAGAVSTVQQCSTNSVMVVIVLCYAFCLNIAGAVFAWKTRNVPEHFNESSQYLVPILFVTIYSILLVPIQFVVEFSPIGLAIIRCIGINIGIIGTVCAMIGPVMEHIVTGNADTPVTVSVRKGGANGNIGPSTIVPTRTSQKP